jgi:hypothetical protein
MIHYPGAGDLIPLPVILDQLFWIVDYSGEHLKIKQPEPFERWNYWNGPVSFTGSSFF